MHTIPDNLLIFIDGKNKTSEIKRFDISKHNVRFVFSLNNKVYTYSRDRVKFKKNVLKSEKAQNIKQYFEKLSLNSPIKIEDSDTSILNNYFNKISKELNIDIDCFSNKALSHFNTKNEWENYNWKEKFPTANFHLNVKANVVSGQIITKT